MGFFEAFKHFKHFKLVLTSVVITHSISRYNEEKELAPNYERYDDHQNETLDERLRRDEDRPHYIDDEEEFERRQNKDMITDLDNLEDDEGGVRIRDGYSSEESESLHRRGRLGKQSFKGRYYVFVTVHIFYCRQIRHRFGRILCGP